VTSVNPTIPDLLPVSHFAKFGGSRDTETAGRLGDTRARWRSQSGSPWGVLWGPSSFDRPAIAGYFV